MNRAVVRAAVVSALGWSIGCGPAGPGDASASGPVATSATGSSGATGSPTSSGGTTVVTGSGASSTTSTDGTASTSGPGAPPIGPPTCDDPQPLLQYDGSPSGFVRCSSGVVHRIDAVACTIPPAPAPCATEPGAQCTKHDDCGAPLGYCDASCVCKTTCATDADCPDDQVCLCTGTHLGGDPTCIPALCRTDADCGGSICAGAIEDGCLDGGLVVELGCHGPASECHANADCPPPGGSFVAMDPLCSPEPQFTCGAAGGGCA